MFVSNNKIVSFSVCWLRNERTGMPERCCEFQLLCDPAFIVVRIAFLYRRETMHLSFLRHYEFFIYFAVLKMCCLGLRAAALVHSSLGVSHIKGKEPSA